MPVLLLLAIAVYACFGVFTAMAGGRLPATLSSAVLNGVACLLPLIVWQTQRMARSDLIATRLSGVAVSILAGLAGC